MIVMAIDKNRQKNRMYRVSGTTSQYSILPPPPSLCIKIADITISLISVDPELKLWVDEATTIFLNPNATPDVTIEGCWDNLAQVENRGKIFDSGSLWQLYQNNGSYLFTFHASVFGPIPYKLVRTKRDFTHSEVSLHRPYFDPDEPIYPLEYPLDELLLVNLLAMGRGVEVHGCGVVDPSGDGHLFIGQSGAGKSTMARLWQDTPGVTILSDDRMILRQIDSKLWMYGTPWHGEAMLASPERAPLTRIYFLERGLKNELIPQRYSDAVGRLIACSFIPFYSQPGLAFTLNFFEKVVKGVPCCELRSVPDKRVIEFINKFKD
jgi:hypothetical protein